MKESTKQLSHISDFSKVSMESQKQLDIVSNISSERIHKLQGVLSEENISDCWYQFGGYIAKQLRSGRAVKVPNFGNFSFTVPEFVLTGVTNPEIRDKQLREPLFIVNKEFLSGLPIQTGIITETGIRPNCVSGQIGCIQTILINYTDIGNSMQMNYDTVRLSLDRVFRQIASQAKKNGYAVMLIPAVGTLYIKNGLAAVNFVEQLKQDVRGIVKKPLEERLMRRSCNLSAEKLRILEQQQIQTDLAIDEAGTNWLNNNLNIQLGAKTEKFKKVSAPRSSSSSAFTNESFFSLSFQSLRKLKNWMKLNKLDATELFQQLTGSALTRTTSQQGERSIINQHRLNKDEFLGGLQKLGLQLQDIDYEQLYKAFDQAGLGYIDQQKFFQIIYDDQKKINQHKLKDAIINYGIQIKDCNAVIAQFDSKQVLTHDDLKQYFQLLDQNINQDIATHLCSIALNGKQEIQQQEFSQTIKTIYNDCIIDQNWLVNIKKKIKLKLSKSGGAQYLLQQFEERDPNSTGKLDTVEFKNVLLQQNLDLGLLDVNRISKYIKNTVGKIDYREFCQQIENSLKNFSVNQPGLLSLAQALITYMQNNALTVIEFIKHIQRKENTNVEDQMRIKNSLMAKLIQKFIFSEMKVHQLENLCDIIDIDKDGFIDRFDLESFVNRYQHEINEKQLQNKQGIENPEEQQINRLILKSQQSKFASSSQQQNVEETSSSNYKNGNNNNYLFPTQPLSQAEFLELNRELERILLYKKISHYDLFKQLDANQDGFITFNEWSQNINNIFKINMKQKEGYFAYLDNQKIGMIDYPRFLEVLSQEKVGKIDKRQEDNWNWQVETLDKIKSWFQKLSISTEEAFRIADVDFDGKISKVDLKQFLVDVIKVPIEFITNIRLNRLYSLLDQFKRGQVLCSDFKKVLVEEQEEGGSSLQLPQQQQTQYPQLSLSTKSFGASRFSSSQSASQASNKRLFFRSQDISSSDWKKNAKQQLSVIIQKKFNSIKNSFDVISGQNQRLLYAKFKQWVEGNAALSNFALTEKLLQQLFADLDPHKKGYLTEHDWVNGFAEFDNKLSMVNEVQQIIATGFQNPKDAFKSFGQGGKGLELTQNEFSNQLLHLMPNRFDQNDLNLIWQSILKSQDDTKLSYEQFLKVFYPQLQTPSRSQQGDKIQQQIVMQNQQTPKSVATLTKISYDNSNQSTNKVIEKMKHILRSTNLSLDSLFQQFDIQKTGYISNLEFKSVLRQINIGLSSTDIDSVINVCESKEGGYINWREFLQRMQLSDTDTRLIQRAKQRLLKLKENIYSYLLSPKDAFRQFNESRTGQMSFDEFKKLIQQVYLLAGEEQPSYQIIKDLFEFIDIRNDGIIDLHEWMESFRKMEEQEVASTQQMPLISNRKQIKILLQNKYAQKESRSAFLIQKPKLMSKSLSLIPNFSNQGQFFENIPIGWECSRDFDEVLKIIGKNRKLIFQKFKAHQEKQKQITFEVAKEILSQILEQNFMRLTEMNWQQLLRFAIRNNELDYTFMMEVFKQRLENIFSHPQKSYR